MLKKFLILFCVALSAHAVHLMEMVWQMAHILKENVLIRIVIIMLSAVVAAVVHRPGQWHLKDKQGQRVPF